MKGEANPEHYRVRPEMHTMKTLSLIGKSYFSVSIPPVDM